MVVQRHLSFHVVNECKRMSKSIHTMRSSSVCMRWKMDGQEAVCAQLCSALIVLVVHASLASHLLYSKNPAQHILCLGGPRLCNIKATQLPHTNWSKPR